MDTPARRQLYAFFSRLFVKELDEGFAAVVRGALGRALLPGLEGTGELEALGGADRAAVFDADFTALTVVNAVPYESFYRRDDAQVEAGAANPVAQFFTRYGFEVDLAAARAVAPDHLGIELELMAELCRREHEAASDGQAAYAEQIRAVERDFLRQHLLAWAPVYLLAVERTAKTALYREGAAAALEFLLADHEALR